MIEYIRMIFNYLFGKKNIVSKPSSTHITTLPPKPKSDSIYLELRQEEQDRLLDIAERCIGIPYRLGAEVLNLNCEPEQIKEIDCSEAIEYWFYKIGYKVRDGSFNQYDDSETITGIFKIGDCGYRRSFETGKISHVFMYVGNDYIIEANGLAKYRRVVKRKLEDVMKDSELSKYVGVRRFLKAKVKKI